MLTLSQVDADNRLTALCRVHPTSADDELIAAFARGNTEGFELLMKRYNWYIYRLAYSLTGNSNDADDIVSETSIRMYRHLSRFQHAVTLPRWIKRIVTNIYNDSWRPLNRRNSTSLEELIEEHGENALLYAQDATVNPLQLAVANEQMHLINHAMTKLDPTQVQMINLYHADERSYEEISAHMGIPIGTVKSRLSRARAALRRELSAVESAFAN